MGEERSGNEGSSSISKYSVLLVVVILAQAFHHSFFFYKNIVFPAQAEYSYFSADFRLKIFLYYS